MSNAYVGRFAPSPTGPLHIGSLITAVASFLEARSHDGRWLLRMEDVDGPRTAPGAADLILRQMEAYGFAWDGEVLWQSQRLHHYQEALEELRNAGKAYACACTRKEIADSSMLTPDGAHRYPGTCRNGMPQNRSAWAWRLKTDETPLTWTDAIQGKQTQNVWQDVGDFVLLRADGLFAYQLAVVVDDAAQGITHIVRGADLLDSTGRQIFLQQQLGYPQIAYAHVPIASNSAHEKLSKQTMAKALDFQRPAATLWLALQFLGQEVPPELALSPLPELWQWAHRHWRPSAIAQVRHQCIMPN